MSKTSVTVAMRQLSVVMFGELPESSLVEFRRVLPGFELIGAPLVASFRQRDGIEAIRAAIVPAANEWLLLLRDGELVSTDLAREVVSAIERENAWGFRIRRSAVYRGRRLSLMSDREGEVRLFHRRHARFGSTSASEILIEGAVVRLQSLLEFEVTAGSGSGMPEVSLLRRAGRFAAAVVANARRIRGRGDLAYLWAESANGRPTASAR